jgi:hypothetical protein
MKDLSSSEKIVDRVCSVFRRPEFAVEFFSICFCTNNKSQVFQHKTTQNFSFFRTHENNVQSNFAF